MGANTNESTETKEKSKGFFSKKESHLMAINQKVISSNLNAKNINIASNQDTTLIGSNISADESLDIKADSI